jgi:hypothetical protein
VAGEVFFLLVGRPPAGLTVPESQEALTALLIESANVGFFRGPQTQEPLQIVIGFSPRHPGFVASPEDIELAVASSA